jgi:predicted O-linked N-acetylglucosamine transferase (SPINDLY family)
VSRTSRDAHARALSLLRGGDVAGAEGVLRAALLRHARDAALAHLMGLSLAQQGKADRAAYFFRSAVEAEPGSGLYRTALANHLAHTGCYEEALERFRGAIEKDPGHAPAHAGLAFCLMKSGDLTGAEAAAREAVARDRRLPQMRVNLASIVTESGRADEAAAVLEAAAADFPRSVPVRASLMVTLNYVAGAEDRAAAAVRRLRDVLPPSPACAFSNSPEPERRLRIAYISGDLRQHSVAYFLEPILAERNRSAFEVVCYLTGPKSDAVTDRLRAVSDGWVEAAALTGEAFIRRLRADRIDIAVDLGGHTSSSRVLALAQRGAPVQATYLGYPASTGVPAIDWRVVDAVTDPPGAEACCTERLAPLPGCFLCYRPPAGAPGAGIRAGGDTTFGSFNSMRKITPEVLSVWAGVLRAVPGSRLVLKNRSLSDGGVRERVMAALGGGGVDRGRVELRGPAPGVNEHLSAYAEIDIGLDTFPYNGTTTTCEALWMGVPVVTMTGRAHAGRVGASLLRTVGLERCIGADAAGYIGAAADLARDGAGRAALRASLRASVGGSALCDPRRFMPGYEGALREMWRDWCRSRPAPAPR